MSVSNPATGTPGAATTQKMDSNLFDYLEEINGTDTYNSTVLATGKLDPSKFLMIPKGMVRKAFYADKVSKSTRLNGYDKDTLVQIYALNKAIFGTDERAIKIALLRVMAVQAGWGIGTYEVAEVAKDNNAETTFVADLPTVKRFSEHAKKLGTLLPMIAEIVFRTMGHHYLTGLDGDYSAKYQRIFNACVEPELTSYLPNADLYHTALHWVSLAEAYEAASNANNISWLPNAIIIRTQSAPAGTALVCTSVAVLEAMDGAGLKSSLVKASGLEVDKLEAVVAGIRSSPLAYHTIPHAYKVAPLADASRAAFDNAKVIAVKLSPVLQGFLDALPNSSSLAGAKALAKHADSNPLMRRRAKVFFKEAGTTKAADLGELFSMNKRHKDAVEVEELDDLTV